jgi:hypothetical protein
MDSMAFREMLNARVDNPMHLALHQPSLSSQVRQMIVLAHRCSRGLRPVPAVIGALAP